MRHALLVTLVVTGCVPPDAVPDALPATAEAVVLAAELLPGAVRVEGTVVSEQHIDLDADPDDRWPFRVEVVDGGEVLWSRTLPGPGVVDAFLGYWSEESGVDLLGSLPTLGRFPVHVPLIEGADQVRFHLRDDDGQWAPAGGYDLSERDADDLGVADVHGFEALHAGGPSAHAVDVAIVGDGYTADELDLFAEHADQVNKRLLAADPLAAFSERLNVWRVDVVSTESGASYDCTDCPLRDTAFGSIFPVEVVNRLTGSRYTTRAIFQTEQWEVARAASVVPWDHVIVLVNTRKSGGMAVHYATATTGARGYGETAVHELAHVLAGLGDEYVFDFCIRDPAFGLPPNVTDDPTSPPWSHWIEDGTDLPTEGTGEAIGAYEGAYNCADLYRPSHSCKMNLGGPFCAVCAEQLVTHVLRHGDPVTGLQIDGRKLTVEGALPDTTVRWFLDGEERGEAPASDGEIRLGALNGSVLEVEATVDTLWIRQGGGARTERWSFDLR